MLSFRSLTLLCLNHMKATMPINIYGVKKRYKIPILSPAAKEVSPALTLLTTCVRHMAHCACVKSGINATKTNNPYFFTAFIPQK